MANACWVPIFLTCCGLVAQSPDGNQRISLREALRTALQNNLQVTIAQQAREQARSEVQSSEGAFDWNLSATLQAAHGRSYAPLPQAFGPELQQKTTSTSRTFNGQLAKTFPWGGNLAFTYAPAFNDASSTTCGGLDANGNPLPANTYSTPSAYSGTLGAKYTQSLLRGLGRDAEAPSRLVVARKHAEAADHQFQLAIINLVASTETQYWDLVFAARHLANKHTSLELARKLLRENIIRVQVGTMAPLEVTQAEAKVARAEHDIIAGEAELRNAQDTLIRALYPAAQRPAALEATDDPMLAWSRLDEADAIKLALDRRVELKASRIDQEIAKKQVGAAVNFARPQLDAYLSYNGSSNNYGAPGPVNSDLFRGDNPGYGVGLSFAVPLQNRAAKGRLSSARADLRGSQLKLRDQELSITLEVRKAIRNVEAAEKGVEAAARTRHFEEKSLDAERKKFENGLSTNFTVLQVMTNLDSARSDETRSQIAYAKAVTAMELAVGNLMEARDFTIR